MASWADDLGSSALPDLPDKYETEEDENGVKTVVEYMINPRTSQRMKVTRKIKVTRQDETIKKAVVDRRTWAKFGSSVVDWEKDAQEKNKLHKAHPDFLEKFSGIGFGQEGITYHPEKQTLDFSSKKKVAMKKKEVVVDVKPVGVWKARNPGSGSLAPSGGGGILGASKPSGAYVPPTLRGADGSRRMDIENIRSVRDDTATLRVSNLSDDTTEDDLQQLFRPFGSLTRVYIAKDRNTGYSRGFAFINFIRREDAAMAMEKLAGYGYDHLILQIEWAQRD